LTRIKNPGIIPAAMPKPLQRALLILILAVAVPLQGYAAASIGICRALAHHGGLSAADHAHGGDHHAGAEHERHGSSSGGSSTPDSHQCAACASCGVAAVISASPALYVSDAPHRGVVIASFPAPEGHVPEGLDRPPLTLLV
jgi:hypothetical protein